MLRLGSAESRIVGEMPSELLLSQEPEERPLKQHPPPTSAHPLRVINPLIVSFSFVIISCCPLLCPLLTPPYMAILMPQISEHLFSLDFCWPLSPLQAFVIAMTIFDG